MSERLVIDDIEKRIINVTSRFSFVRNTKTILKTTHTIKVRLDVTEECFIQIYRNTRKNLASYAIVLGRVRIYGRDCDGGVWHKHPEDNPETHDFSQEGSREISLEEFLFEIQEILLKKGIL